MIPINQKCRLVMVECIKTCQSSKIWKALFYNGLGIFITVFIAFLDYITGYQLSFSIFYLIPIIIVTWYVGRWQGLVMSTLGIFSWAFADHRNSHPYDSQIIYYWNAAVRFGFFVIIVFVFSRLKLTLHKEHLLSRMDSMTGIANRMGFNERLETELEKARRYVRPFSLAYIDCDNFKQVNDKHGHQEGDELLAVVGGIIRENIRSVDFGARMGGDEFAVILPETTAAESWEVLYRLQSNLKDSMESRNWPVTFSVGLVTYQTPPISIIDTVREADNLMYAVKGTGKGRMEQLTING